MNKGKGFGKNKILGLPTSNFFRKQRCHLLYLSGFKRNSTFAENIFFTVKLLFFGPLADIAGKTQFDLSGIQNTDDLKRKIFELHPELASHTFLIAVNKKVHAENVGLNIDDEVALLPPFSGG